MKKVEDLKSNFEKTGKSGLISEAVKRYCELWPNSVEQSRLVRAYSLMELRENKVVTANPYTPGNSEFEKYSSIDRESFLKSRLTGKVIDVGSGGINELEGMSEAVVYVDSQSQVQDNFYQVDVGREQLPFGIHTFDGAYSRNTISEPSHAQAILSELLRVVRPGGKVILELQYLPESLQRAVEGIMKTLHQLGLNDLDVQPTLDEAYIQHKTYKVLHFNQPSLFLEVRKKDK